LGGAIQTAADSSREHAAAAFHMTHFLPMYCLPTGEKRRTRPEALYIAGKTVGNYFPIGTTGSSRRQSRCTDTVSGKML
jgi:hypothetical protein